MNPTQKLEVNGNVLTNNVVVPSDRRLKRDIHSLQLDDFAGMTRGGPEDSKTGLEESR
ncbi:MAG: hypothetical protein WBW88_04385 [Rhodothermales bacterium]